MAVPVPGTRPNPARVHNAMLGGRANLAADREAAARVEASLPGMTGLVRANREFARGAVTWLASRGIRQFLDVGCGLPVPPTAGDVAREVQPDARVAYADGDPCAGNHLRSLARREGAAAVSRDVSAPGDVLADPGLREVISLRQPAAVLLCGTLSAVDAGTAGKAVAGYAGALAPGSAIVISCISYARQEAGDAAAWAWREATGGTWFSHSRGAIEGFFADAGLELVADRVMPIDCWPMCAVGEEKGSVVSALGGIGLKR